MFNRYELHFFIVLERCVDGLFTPKHVPVFDKGRTVIGLSLESSLLSVLKHI